MIQNQQGEIPFSYIGFLLIFYGLYFGVLGRDCAEMCTDRLASKMGVIIINLSDSAFSFLFSRF